MFWADKDRAEQFAKTNHSAETQFSHVVDGMPLFFDTNLRPITLGNRFFSEYTKLASKNSVKAYASDFLKFLRFANNQGIDLVNAKLSDITSYRVSRSKLGHSNATQVREMVIVREFYKFLLNTKSIDELPWITIGRTNSAIVKSKARGMRIRALTHDEWQTFYDVGLGGNLPNGDLDPSFRGTNTLRDRLGAKLALTTGMRLREWRTLLTAEFESRLDSDGASFPIESMAKGEYRRTIYIPEDTLHDIELYQSTERRRVVRKAQNSLRANRHVLAEAINLDRLNHRITYRFNGSTFTYPLHRVPEQHRKVLVSVGSDSIEPLSLFVGRSGQALSERAWLAKFQDASRRVEGLVPQRASTKVTPHDLRHTFAVVLLRELQLLAAKKQTQRANLGTGTIWEQLAFNPLLVLQRLLGHASPATTAIYIHYIDDSLDVVNIAFEQWSNSDKDFAELFLDTLEKWENV
ncbi:tyrosine-type recombinase/integrase [Corynebacterium flavescens]|uniref:tyrosine-type recombinase/integrase n=1 Tax=Corynebacterium flavescens TaxID=28028 RepID=UPI00264A46F7|nr:tyrosine-type recombinase/integrase [Corynebacterium flavescens]MDN6822942.1 tyrosine-type recombinase/integrase [Corynebacterium flavescens]